MPDSVSDPSHARARATLAVLSCVVIWAVNYPAMKVALREIDPFAYTGARFVLATAVLAAWAAAAKAPLLPRRGDLGLALLLALSSIGVYQWFFALGVDATTGFAAALLNSTSPLFSLLLVALLRTERLSRRTVAGTLLAYAGVALFVRSAHGGALGSLRGNLLCLGSAACWAFYNVGASRIAGRMSPLSAQAVTFLLGTPVLLLYCAPAVLRQEWGRVGPLSFTILVLSAFLPLVLAFRAWNHGIEVLGVARTASFGFLIPVVAGVTSALWTGERFDAMKLLSAAVVLAGLALIRSGRTSSAP